jgi:hypothetical protein
MEAIMSEYLTRLEPHTSPNNPLVALTTKIETVVENEEVELAMSALFSAIMRLEIRLCEGDTHRAAMGLVTLFKDVMRSCEN